MKCVEGLRCVCSSGVVVVAVERRRVQARRRSDALGLSARLSVSAGLRTRCRRRACSRSSGRGVPCRSFCPRQGPPTCHLLRRENTACREVIHGTLRTGWGLWAVSVWVHTNARPSAATRAPSGRQQIRRCDEPSSRWASRSALRGAARYQALGNTHRSAAIWARRRCARPRSSGRA